MAKKSVKKAVKKAAVKKASEEDCQEASEKAAQEGSAKKAGPKPLFPGFFTDKLAKTDPKVAKAIAAELGRQQHEIELIASENIVSRAVLEAQGSVMTNKYAEGYPGRRYYGGCQYVDVSENLAIERAKQLFDCAFANVQPHSGAQANQAVFFALLQPGDTYMGLDLACGGHLTHGSPVNQSGKWFKVAPYKVREDNHLIDYEVLAVACPRHQAEADHRRRFGLSAHPRFQAASARSPMPCGAYLMVDMAHFAGLVAGGVHPNPLEHAHVVTTTTHKTLRGPRGGMILSRDEDLGKKINSAVFPGLQGGPLEHVIAAKAVAFGEALKPAFKKYAKAVADNAKVLAQSDARWRLRSRLRRHRHPSDAGRPAQEGRDRQGRRTGAGPRLHHLQQERHSLRSGPLHHHQRHPPRHARRHHARLRHGRIPRSRRADHRSAGRACEERRSRAMPRSKRRWRRSRR